jgi:hypothetical protein
MRLQFIISFLLRLTRTGSEKGSIVGENFAKPASGSVQAGLDGTDWIASKFMNFLKCVTFRVVQEHDTAMFLAELGQRSLESDYFI